MARAIRRALAFGLMMVLAVPAAASHYRLPADLVDAEEHTALAAAGIDTTLALQRATATGPMRVALAAKSGLPQARINVLACQADLLRVNGVGPSMVKLLQASGVKHLAHLRQATAVSLRDTMREMNRVHRFAPVLPQVEVVEAWVAEAKSLPQLLMDVP